jgi:hypothetical protein
MRYGPKNLKISFTGNHLTHFGGVYLLAQFLKQIQLRRLLSRHMTFAQRNTRYTVAEEVTSLLFPIMVGIGRIETTQMLRYDDVFHYLTGLRQFPTATTLRRFLVRMAPVALTKLRTLHDRLLSRMMEKPKAPTRVIFDLDSTVLTLYGKQEFAHKGYNPKKHGRVSYHPLLCFNGLTKDYWHGELRPGDVHTATGTTALLQEAFAKLPLSVRRIFIRGDKGFYDHKIIEAIEAERGRFAIVAKLTQPLKRKLSSLRYRTYRSGIQTAEFRYQPTNWQSKYRFVVIRRPVHEEPSDQLSLFEMGRFTYQVIVTNMALRPLNIWRFYNQRAAIELIIKELKSNYPLAKIPTKHFAANEAYFHLLFFAYNLVNWFKRLCLPTDSQHKSLASLRAQLLLIPGELTNAHNRPTLKLPKRFPHQKAFWLALKTIHKLNI